MRRRTSSSRTRGSDPRWSLPSRPIPDRVGDDIEGGDDTDRILIKGLLCRAHVGVPAAERRQRQRVLLDLELGLDLRKAGRSDRVEETVDYAAVTREVKRLVEGRPFILAEAMAESAAGLVLKRFAVDGVTVRVRKFSVPGTSSVGVEVTRQKPTGVRHRGA